MKRNETIQRSAGLSVAALLLSLFLPVQADAQQDATFEDLDEDGRSFSIDARAGLASPVGDLSDLADEGPTVGLGLTFHASNRVGIRLDGNWSFFSEGEFETEDPLQGPELEFLHYTAGLELELTDPETSTIHITVNGGAGGTSIRSDAFTVGQEQDEFDENYFTTHAGLRLGAGVAESVRIFADGQYFWVFSDEDDTGVFNTLTIGDQTFDQLASIPVTVGLRVSF